LCPHAIDQAHLHHIKPLQQSMWSILAQVKPHGRLGLVGARWIGTDGKRSWASTHTQLAAWEHKPQTLRSGDAGVEVPG